MTKFYGVVDFKILYYNFIKGDMSQKLFMMKDYESESACWGRGAIVNLDKAEPFLLNIIFEWSRNNPDGYIGDERTFYYLVNKQGNERVYQKIRKSHRDFNKRVKRMRSLHNILRKHKGIRISKGEKITI